MNYAKRCSIASNWHCFGMNSAGCRDSTSRHFRRLNLAHPA
jgi:hypothetical protein